MTRRLRCVSPRLSLARSCSLPDAASRPIPASHRQRSETAPTQFVGRLESRNERSRARTSAAAGFTYATYINPDTEFLNAKANERYLEYFGEAVEQAKAYDEQQLAPSDARALKLLKLGVSAPAPKDPVKRARTERRSPRRWKACTAQRSTARRVRNRCKDQTQLTEHSGDEPQLRRAHGSLDRLALDGATDAQGVRALRRTRE